MDRNMRQNSYMNNGHRSLPHMNGMNGKGRNHHVNIARLSPPNYNHSNSHTYSHMEHHTQHEDLITYIYESWNKVTRELDKGTNCDIKYYEMVPRQLPPNFRPFDLEGLCDRRM